MEPIDRPDEMPFHWIRIPSWLQFVWTGYALLTPVLLLALWLDRSACYPAIHRVLSHAVALLAIAPVLVWLSASRIPSRAVRLKPWRIRWIAGSSAVVAVWLFILPAPLAVDRSAWSTEVYLRTAGVLAYTGWVIFHLCRHGRLRTFPAEG